MKQLIFIIAAALLAAGTCNRINARNMEKPKKISAFPVGDKLPETFSKYFVGQAYLARLTRNGALNCPISNVTFEPGCRNNWHSHTGGQILVAVGGRGYYQAEGEGFMAVTDGLRKYIHLQRQNGKKRELIDLMKDPHEFDNRVSWPEYQAEAAHLEEKMLEHMIPSVLA